MSTTILWNIGMILVNILFIQYQFRFPKEKRNRFVLSMNTLAILVFSVATFQLIA